MQQYTLLLLDIDGTLLDFHTAEEKALKDCFANFDIEYTDKNLKTYLHVNQEVWNELEQGKIDPANLSTERFTRFIARIGKDTGLAPTMSAYFMHKLSQGKDMMPYALEFLKAIPKSQHIAYITNGLSQVQRGRLAEHPIMEYCDALYISEETGYPKPSPEMIYMAMKDFNITDKSQVLFIGDSLSSDVGAANNAGIDCLYLAERPSNKAKYQAKNLLDAIAFTQIEAQE
ncbi:MAG: HAD-IA family hydrolase [Eubacteriales bacterium]|nr:HAD-IA family hydrolase [Eubacteriales bacterium]